MAFPSLVFCGGAEPLFSSLKAPLASLFFSSLVHISILCTQEHKINRLDWLDGSRVGETRTRIPLRPRCSKDDSRFPENSKNDKGDRLSTDWDKVCTKFQKQGKKSMFSEFKPDKYVNWNPRHSDYPLSEEVDPIKRTERPNLMLWTSPKFTLTGAIVMVSMLLIYTLLAPLK